MRSHFSCELPIVHHRKAFFCLSGALLALAVVGILVRGLVFGIEFVGGTEVDFRDTGSVTISQMRTALSDAGEKGVTVQTAVTDGSAGFLVRSETVDPNVATAHAAKAAESLGLADDSFQVTTIGPCEDRQALQRPWRGSREAPRRDSGSPRACSRHGHRRHAVGVRRRRRRQVVGGLVVSAKVTLANPQGLHLRPATTLAGMMCDYPCAVRLVYDSADVDAKSPLSLVGLSLEQGSEVEFRCDGECEDEALAAAVDLFLNNMD